MVKKVTGILLNLKKVGVMKKEIQRAGMGIHCFIFFIFFPPFFFLKSFATLSNA